MPFVPPYFTVFHCVIYATVISQPSMYHNFSKLASVLSASQQDLAICTNFQFATVFFSCVSSPTIYHRMSMTSSQFSRPTTRTVLLTILSKLYKFTCPGCTVLLLQLDSVFVTDFLTCNFPHLSNARSQNWIFSESKSRQKWAHQSESICIYFLGFISLICYGDLHCFNSFIICNWLAISSGYISSVN